MQLKGKRLTRLIGSYLISVASLLEKISASGRSVPSLPSLPSLLSHEANI